MSPATLRLLATAHRWTGLLLALPLAAIVLAGLLLLFRDLLWVPPTWRTSDVPAAQADAALLAALAAEPGWRHVELARPGRAFHRVGLDDGRLLWLRVGATRPEPPPARLAAEHWLFEVHTRLLLGEPGRAFVRVLGPLALAALAVGLLLWWPRRRAFQGRHLLPAGGSRLALLRLHSGWGATAAVLVVPLVLSGALLAHNPTIRGWLKPLAPPAPAAPAAPDAAGFAPGELGAALAAVRAAWPEGRLTQWSRTASAAAVISFKFRLPGERHPNGRSLATADLATGRLASLRDARAGGVPAAYDDFLYAFHTGERFGPVQRASWLVAGGALVLLLGSGALAWLRGRGARGRGPA